VDFCFAHNPAMEKKRAAARAMGGYHKAGAVPIEVIAKRFTRSDQLLDILAEAISAVRTGALSAKAAGAIGVLSNAYVRALEFFSAPSELTAMGMSPEDAERSRERAERERREAMRRIRELYGLSAPPTHLTVLPAGGNGTGGNGTH
jgi:hypothetical protein